MDTHPQDPSGEAPRLDAPRRLAAALKRWEKLREAMLELGRMERSLERHAFVVEGAVEEARKVLAGARAALDEVSAEIPPELDRVASEAEGARARVRDRMGHGIAERMEALGLFVSGRFPELQIGPWGLRLRPERGDAEIALGPGGDVLDRPSLEVEAICQAVERLHGEHMEGDFEREAFLGQVRRALVRANRVAARPTDAPVPIPDFLVELNVAAQRPAFAAAPSRRSFRPVTRLEAAIGLFRARPLAGEGFEVRMIVATREQTRKRYDNLYVPTNLRGQGTRFGALQLRQTRR